MKTARKLFAAILSLLTAASVFCAPLTVRAVDAGTAESAEKTEIVRLGGQDRFGTSVVISAEGWDKADTVLIANAYNYADALAGAPLAGALDAPILLTGSDSVPDTVVTEIRRLGAKKIIILGGTAAVSEEAERSFSGFGIETGRIAGATRFETAEKIAEELKKTVGTLSEVFIASGANYPDALSASSAAALRHAPILYSPKSGAIDEQTLSFIEGSGAGSAYILGGENAVGKAAETGLKSAGAGKVERLGGSDRYDTSLKIAKRFDGDFKSDDIAFATGQNFPDALAGSVFAAKKSVPVVLTDNASVSDAQKAFAAARERSRAYVFGGESVVKDKVVNCFLGKIFMFSPKVSNAYIEEIFGKEKVQVWYNIVDAILAGKDTFKCPDQDTYDWVIYQFPNRCFPGLDMLIEPQNFSVKNGTGSFKYKKSKAEREKQITDFEELVEELLNKTMKPWYSDLEKALALYEYFTKTYTYDYETFERMKTEYVSYTSSYRLLTGGTGICSEISTAYSYLLMQAGVDATIMMGGDHQWSYVRIKGKNYHIDPTFGLGQMCELRYFMMDDAKRAGDGFDADQFVIASVYSQEHKHPDYKADDKTFSPLWDYWYKDFDHSAHTITYYGYDDSFDEVYYTFDYKDF